VAVALGLGQPLEHQQPRALAPRHAVGRRRERLAAPVRREPALARELHEHPRLREHGHPARQRQRALAGPQRLRRQVQRDQRRRARGVDAHRRTLEPERIRHASGHDAARDAGRQVPVETRRRLAPDRVVLVHDAGEDAGVGPAQRGRVDPRVLERLPRRLQEQPLLRIHGQRLARRDAEELRVELAGALEEPAVARVARARMVGVRVVQALDVPAAVGRERADPVAAFRDELPQLVRRAHAAGQAAAHADDRDRLVAPRQLVASFLELDRHPLEVLQESLVVSHGSAELPVDQFDDLVRRR
jgi:hypothetical protein